MELPNLKIHLLTPDTPEWGMEEVDLETAHLAVKRDNLHVCVYFIPVRSNTSTYWLELQQQGAFSNLHPHCSSRTQDGVNLA